MAATPSRTFPASTATGQIATTGAPARRSASGRTGNVGDEAGDQVLAASDAVHDARAEGSAHELERALLPCRHLLRAGLGGDEPQALVRIRLAERQSHEHDSDLISR